MLVVIDITTQNDTISLNDRINLFSSIMVVIECFSSGLALQMAGERIYAAHMCRRNREARVSGRKKYRSLDEIMLRYNHNRNGK